MSVIVWIVAIPIILLACCILLVVVEAERQSNKDWRNWR